MRKLVFLVLVSFVAFVSCSTATDSGSDVSNNEQLSKCLNGAPAWVMGSVEGGFSTVGSAPLSKAGLTFSRTAAMGNARDAMARSISVKVNNMLKNFTQSTGIGDDETVDKVTTDVSRQLSSQTLQGTVQKALWVSPCDEVYVLVGIDQSGIQQIKNMVASSYNNDNALWQQFQAQKAQDELSFELQKEFGGN
jgi:hypothetical protein